MTGWGKHLYYIHAKQIYTCKTNIFEIWKVNLFKKSITHAFKKDELCLKLIFSIVHLGG